MLLKPYERCWLYEQNLTLQNITFDSNLVVPQRTPKHLQYTFGKCCTQLVDTSIWTQGYRSWPLMEDRPKGTFDTTETKIGYQSITQKRPKYNHHGFPLIHRLKISKECHLSVRPSTTRKKSIFIVFHLPKHREAAIQLLLGSIGWDRESVFSILLLLYPFLSSL